MKILVLSDVGPGRMDQGDKIRLSNFTGWLARNNEVTLLSFEEVYQDGLRAIVVPPPGRIGKIVRSILAPNLPATVASRKTGLMKRAVRELNAQEEFDVVLAYQPKMCTYLTLFDCPSVVDFTDAISLYYGRMAEYSGQFCRLFYKWEQVKMRRFEKNVLGQKRLCLLASEVDARYLRSLAPEARIVVVPNGVDTCYFSPASESPSGLDLVFMGNMAYRPNEDGLLSFYREVLPRVLTQCHQARLVIVGKNPPASILALNADPAVVVTGYVPDVRPYLADGAVVISPLRFGAGTRLKILEAMAMGKAVVSSSIGAEGLKVTPGLDVEMVDRPEVMAEKIVELLNDKGKRLALGERARETVAKEYQWERICCAMEELLVSEAQIASPGQPAGYRPSQR